jgi:hypothetical protein
MQVLEYLSKRNRGQLSNILNKIKVSRPGGLTVREFKKRAKKTSTENMACRRHYARNGAAVKFGWCNTQKTGLNTSGPLSGLRASSFNHPVLAPPTPTFTL